VKGNLYNRSLTQAVNQNDSEWFCRNCVLDLQVQGRGLENSVVWSKRGRGISQMGFLDDATLIPQVNGPIQWMRGSVALKHSCGCERVCVCVSVCVCVCVCCVCMFFLSVCYPGERITWQTSLLFMESVTMFCSVLQCIAVCCDAARPRDEQ